MIGPSGFMKAPAMTEQPADSPRVRPPTCHFTPMKLAWADDWPNGQVEYWECHHCGHTKEAGRSYPAC